MMFSEKERDEFSKILAPFLIIAGVLFFMTGIHGIDNAWNMQYLGECMGMRLIDTNAFNAALEKGGLYSQSLIFIFTGFLLTAAGCLCLNYYKNVK
jgi:hypothetical protein